LNGINGTNGATGTQGPAGITSINDTNTYFKENVSRNLTNSGVFLTISSVFCDSEDVVIQRSLLVDSVLSDAVIIQDIQLPPSGWQVMLKSTTDFEPFTLQVRCFDNSPLR